MVVKNNDERQEQIICSVLGALTHYYVIVYMFFILCDTSFALKEDKAGFVLCFDNGRDGSLHLCRFSMDTEPYAAYEPWNGIYFQYA